MCADQSPRHFRVSVTMLAKQHCAPGNNQTEREMHTGKWKRKHKYWVYGVLVVPKTQEIEDISTLPTFHILISVVLETTI